MSRTVIKCIARLLIGALFVAQIVLSAYACPGRLGDAGGAVAAADAPSQVQATMPGCDEAPGSAMDPDSPALCAEHCKQGQQSDQVPTVSVPAVALSVLYTKPLAAPAEHVVRRSAAPLGALVATSPPHAIAHCVFRI